MYTIPWSMPIDPPDAHTDALTYVDHTLSQVPTQNFMQILLSMASVSPLCSEPRDLIKQFSHLQFCEGWENENREKSVGGHINCS